MRSYHVLRVIAIRLAALPVLVLIAALMLMPSFMIDNTVTYKKLAASTIAQEQHYANSTQSRVLQVANLPAQKVTTWAYTHTAEYRTPDTVKDDVHHDALFSNMPVYQKVILAVLFIVTVGIFFWFYTHTHYRGN